MTHALLVANLACALLCTQLSARPFRVREHATRVLAAAGPLAWAALDRAGAFGPEAHARAYRLLPELREVRLRAAAAQLLPDGYPRLPWLSMWADGGETFIAGPWWDMAKAAKRTWPRSCACPQWEWDRRATLLWVESRLRGGEKAEAIVSDLNGMRDRERNWIQENGANYKPPLTIPKE